MSIRVAVIQDVPRIIELGEQMHAESPRWSRIPFNRARAAESMTNVILSVDGVVFLAENDGVVIGELPECCSRTGHATPISLTR
ncbi:hypothetical protein ACJBUE_22400 (plasmid) [Ralstonia syzygii subsp. celebesensis]|uniref:hypothetical protein n=1 Tax=Ralstonia syzygii TaxID=28097 RepID=UPI00387E1ADD